MDTSSSEQPTVTCHVVAIPFPGRGHVNPMMNFCKLMAQSQPRTTVISFIVTEEWHGFLSSESKLPPNIRLVTIPNIIPSEIGRGKDWPGFVRAAFTKLEAPVEQLLDRLDELLPKPKAIIHDAYLNWVVDVGNRRNIPVASFWTESATLFSIFHHFNLILEKGHFNSCLKEKGKEKIDYIPGVPAFRVADLPTPLTGNGGQEVLLDCLEGISLVSKAQYLLLTSTYELEHQVIDALGKEFAIPVYSIGPAIPHFNVSETESSSTPESQPEYVKWLDAQPEKSVLYISQGSFLSISKAQLDEIVSGVHESGIRFLWVTRGDTNSFERSESGNGKFVPWCDQLKVLSHPSIGGFWSHCGWNSTKEAIFAGIPMIVFPIFWDQTTNAKQIVDDFKMGWRFKKDDDTLVTSAEIAGLIRKFMDLGSDEGKEIRRRAKELQTTCQEALKLGGSSRIAIDAFLADIW